jgi:hypothetical protein
LVTKLQGKEKAKEKVEQFRAGEFLELLSSKAATSGSA